MNKSIYTVIEVTNMSTKTSEDWKVPGSGQEIMKSFRKRFPFFTKFVLLGHIINDKYIPLDLKRR